MPAMPRFDNTWTMGNSVTLLAMIIGGAMVWGQMRSEMAFQAQTMIRLEGLIVAESSTTDTYETRIRSLELNAGRTDEKLLNILAALDRIEKRLEEPAN